jgi:PTS system ascorbate-specific IIC component
VDAGLSGFKLIALAAVFTALYMVIAPNLMRPLVRKVTGKDEFTIGHPTTTLSVLSALYIMTLLQAIMLPMCIFIS